MKEHKSLSYRGVAVTSNKRIKIILEKLENDGFVSTSDLSKELSVSEVTARNYINQLEKDGMLRRTHGGARKVKGMSYEPTVEEVENSNIGLKRTISIKALDYIEDGDTIMIDTSSTCRQLALRIKESKLKDIVLITNSYLTHWELMDANGIKLIHLGGETNQRMKCSNGMMTIKAMNYLRASKTFIGANGIDLDAGITTVSLRENDIKREMMSRSNLSFALMDSSKFDKTFVAVVGGLNDFDYFITDQNIPEKYVKAFENMTCKLVIAKSSDDNCL